MLKLIIYAMVQTLEVTGAGHQPFNQDYGHQEGFLVRER